MHRFMRTAGGGVIWARLCAARCAPRHAIGDKPCTPERVQHSVCNLASLAIEIPNLAMYPQRA